jgi:hypothetical protein
VQQSHPDKGVYRWASGRRRYNRLRQCQAQLRWAQLRQYLPALLLHRGLQARLARILGVHRSTICRDAQCLWKAICEGEAW